MSAFVRFLAFVAMEAEAQHLQYVLGSWCYPDRAGALRHALELGRFRLDWGAE